MAESIENLPCTLTEEEKAVKSKELCTTLLERAALELEKKDTMADFKKSLSDKNDEIDELARLISTGIEYRPVACRDFERFERNQVETVRLDTGEVVRSRVMGPSERQTAMALDDSEHAAKSSN